MRIALVVAALLVGCRSTSAPPPVSSAVTGPAPAPSPVIELGELTLTFDGQPIAHVHADGRTESVSHGGPGDPMIPGPTFHADGTISNPRGEQNLRVAPGGEIHLLSASSDEVVAHVTSDTLTFMSNPSEPIRLDGDVLLLPGGADRNRVVGATTPGLRRTMLVVTAVYYFLGS